MLNSRKFKDSGVLLHLSIELTTGSLWVVDLDEKWKPYSEASIINLDDDNDILAGSLLVPKGSQRQITNAFHNLSITNVGAGTILAEKIRVEVRHSGK